MILTVIAILDVRVMRDSGGFGDDTIISIIVVEGVEPVVAMLRGDLLLLLQEELSLELLMQRHVEIVVLVSILQLIGSQAFPTPTHVYCTYCSLFKSNHPHYVPDFIARF